MKPSCERHLTVTDILKILLPSFSEAGSNALQFEKRVFSCFIKYLREVGAGRRCCGQTSISFPDILKLVTGSSKEPMLGYSIKPKVTFSIPLENININHKKPSFVPTAHTCSNDLLLPRPTHVWNLPQEEDLFAIYDMAFSTSYFGKQ